MPGSLTLEVLFSVRMSWIATMMGEDYSPFFIATSSPDGPSAQPVRPPQHQEAAAQQAVQG